MKTTKQGKPCYKWGTTGKTFAFKTGSASSQTLARQRALLQGRMASSAKKAKRG